MDLKINIDTASIASQFKELAMEVEQDLNKAVGNLAVVTHAKVAELASTELKSSLKTLKDNLGFAEISPGVWVVSIDEGALWIEEGIEQGMDIKPGLLKNNAKTSKSGSKYKIVPFDHGKAPSQLTPSALSIVSLLKEGLKQNKIPFKKIEKNSNGSPRLGKLHVLDIKSPIPGKGNTPSLKGVSIYQTMTKTGNVRRDILTFRTVSDSPASEGKWIHPGLEAKHFLEKSADWALNQWENIILPEILDKYK